MMLAVLPAGFPARASAVEPAASAPAGDLSYQHAVDLYEHGDYAEAAKRLQEVLEDPPVGLTQEKIKRAWLYRGISLFITGDHSGADKAFWQVLLIDPKFRPDPLFTLPAVIAAFDAVRIEHAEQLPKVTDPLKDPTHDPLPPKAAPSGGFLDAVSPVLPFGYAQYRNGQSAKGLGLGVAEGVLGVATFVTWVNFQEINHKSGVLPQDYQSAKNDQDVNIGAGAALLVAIAYGAIDGVYFSRKVEVTPGPTTAGLSLSFRF